MGQLLVPGTVQPAGDQGQERVAFILEGKTVPDSHEDTGCRAGELGRASTGARRTVSPCVWVSQ